MKTLRKHARGKGGHLPDGQRGIWLKDITVSYGRKTVLNGISFSAEPGQVIGLMGPNGTGKTTLISVLAGLLCPQYGTGSICGMPLGGRTHVPCGIMFEHPPFDDDRTGKANLVSLAQLAGYSTDDAQTAAQDVMKRVGLEPELRTRVGRYSQGMRKRLGFAQTMLGSPHLYLLDEPANGLDPLAVIAMRSAVRRLASSGAIVVISSHALHELSLVCDKVYMLIDGSCHEVTDTEHLEDVYVGYATARSR